MCLLWALLEMRVLFEGGPYMRKYGILLFDTLAYCLEDLDWPAELNFSRSDTIYCYVHLHIYVSDWLN